MIGKMQVNGKWGRDKLKKKRMKVNRESMKACGVDEDIIYLFYIYACYISNI